MVCQQAREIKLERVGLVGSSEWATFHKTTPNSGEYPKIGFAEFPSSGNFPIPTNSTRNQSTYLLPSILIPGQLDLTHASSANCLTQLPCASGCCYGGSSPTARRRHAVRGCVSNDAICGWLLVCGSINGSKTVGSRRGSMMATRRVTPGRTGPFAR